MTEKATDADIKNIAENEKGSFSIPLSEKELYEMLRNPLYRIITAKDGDEYAGPVSYTHLSSSEWKVITASLPPFCIYGRMFSRRDEICVSSPFTSILIA